MGNAVEDVVEVASDIAATATGNPELIPLINAGETAAGDVAQGESIGKSLGQGAISGGEALAGQELAGAVGVGQGNTTFNDALGITGDNPAGTGLPDIGAAASNAIGGVTDSLGITTPSASSNLTNDATLGSDTTNAAGATVNPSGTTVAAPATATSSAPATGGIVSPANIGDVAANQIGSTLDQGATTSPTSLGTVGGSQIGGLSQADLALQTPPTIAAANNISSGDVAPSVTSTGTSSPSLLSQAESVGLKSALPLGALAYEAIKGPASLPSASTALAPGGANTAPLTAIETANANEAATGQLTPSQQASILQQVQGAQNQLIQQLASEGVTNPTQDSRYIAGMQQIQQAALAQQQAFIQQAVTNAVSAGGAASGNIATVANEQVQNDTAFQDALAQAFGALGGSIGGVTLPKAS